MLRAFQNRMASLIRLNMNTKNILNPLTTSKFSEHTKTKIASKQFLMMIIAVDLC